MNIITCKPGESSWYYSQVPPIFTKISSHFSLCIHCISGVSYYYGITTNAVRTLGPKTSYRENTEANWYDTSSRACIYGVYGTIVLLSLAFLANWRIIEYRQIVKCSWPQQKGEERSREGGQSNSIMQGNIEKLKVKSCGTLKENIPTSACNLSMLCFRKDIKCN